MTSIGWRWATVGAAALAALLAPMLWKPANGTTPFVMTNIREDPRLSLMTYNVEGLPWPARFGRSADLQKIGTRFQALRLLGQQPHIVALQEAFSYDAKRVGIDGGYRYIANGPDKNLQPTGMARPSDTAFQSARGFFVGERSGKLVDSGLQILSDYPILSVRRMAFPAYACAGYDCLANKGALLAMIEVPGLSEPIAVVNVHLNSHAASGVDDARSLYAYRRQIDLLDAFLASVIKPGTPVIVAGDFNVGARSTRRSYFEAHFRKWGANSSTNLASDALRQCLGAVARPCGSQLPDDASYSLQHARDWQIAVPGTRYALGVNGLSVPFGHDIDGMMLSDHVGYTAYYKSIALPASFGFSQK